MREKKILFPFLHIRAMIPYLFRQSAMNLWLSASLPLISLSPFMLVPTIDQVAFRLSELSVGKIRFQVASMFAAAGFASSESERLASN